MVLNNASQSLDLSNIPQLRTLQSQNQLIKSVSAEVVLLANRRRRSLLAAGSDINANVDVMSYLDSTTVRNLVTRVVADGSLLNGLRQRAGAYSAASAASTAQTRSTAAPTSNKSTGGDGGKSSSILPIIVGIAVGVVVVAVIVGVVIAKRRKATAHNEFAMSARPNSSTVSAFTNPMYEEASSFPLRSRSVKKERSMKLSGVGETSTTDDPLTPTFDKQGVTNPLYDETLTAQSESLYDETPAGVLSRRRINDDDPYSEVVPDEDFLNVVAVAPGGGSHYLDVAPNANGSHYLDVAPNAGGSHYLDVAPNASTGHYMDVAPHPPGGGSDSGHYLDVVPDSKSNNNKKNASPKRGSSSKGGDDDTGHYMDVGSIEPERLSGRPGQKLSDLSLAEFQEPVFLDLSETDNNDA